MYTFPDNNRYKLSRINFKTMKSAEPISAERNRMCHSGLYGYCRTHLVATLFIITVPLNPLHPYEGPTYEIASFAEGVVAKILTLIATYYHFINLLFIFII